MSPSRILDDGDGDCKPLVDFSSSGCRRPWSEMKLGSSKLASLYSFANRLKFVISDRRLIDLRDCGNRLEFAVFPDGHKELRRAWFCRVRLCPMCMWRRSLKLAVKMKRAIESAKSSKPSFRFLFVTFTQRNCSGSALGETLTKMTFSFSKVLKRDERLSRCVLGYMRSIEVTVNTTEWSCHPHIHAILVVRSDYFSGRNYVKQMDWREMWRASMGLDYLPLVNVKELKGSDWDVVEAAKYSVKAIDSLADVPDRTAAARMLVDLTVGLRKRRLVSFGGVFRDVKFADGHESGSSDDIDVGRVIYRWAPLLGVYVESGG